MIYMFLSNNPSSGDITRRMCLVEISYGDLWWGTKACYTPTKLEGYSFGPYLSTLKFDAFLIHQSQRLFQIKWQTDLK